LGSPIPISENKEGLIAVNRWLTYSRNGEDDYSKITQK
jgi:hypothetical protein